MSKASQTVKNGFSGCGKNRFLSAFELDAIYSSARGRTLSTVVCEVRP